MDVSENIAPFSFFSYIVYNSSLYNSTELENILEHEKIHSEQNHTTDVLISRIFCIVFWFNPIVWLYKKAIMQNLEFIADVRFLAWLAALAAMVHLATLDSSFGQGAGFIEPCRP